MYSTIENIVIAFPQPYGFYLVLVFLILQSSNNPSWLFAGRSLACMVALTRMIGRGVGFGKRLAKGAGNLAAECGHPELSDIADSFLNKQT
jgi:hypothetical protein